MSKTQSITCPECGTVSYHHIDVKFGYCGNCYTQTSAPLRPDEKGTMNSPYDAEAVRLQMNEETMRSRKKLKDNPMAHETARRYDEMTGTMNTLYNVETEAALLARDLAKLRPRIRLLAKNLDHPRHAVEALKSLDRALEEIAAI